MIYVNNSHFSAHEHITNQSQDTKLLDLNMVWVLLSTYLQAATTNQPDLAAKMKPIFYSQTRGMLHLSNDLLRITYHARLWLQQLPQY